MINSKYYLETPTLMAYILVVVVLSIGIERLVNIFLEKSDAGDYRGSRLKRELGKAARRNSREAKIPDGEAVFAGHRYERCSIRVRFKTSYRSCGYDV